MWTVYWEPVSKEEKKKSWQRGCVITTYFTSLSHCRERWVLTLQAQCYLQSGTETRDCEWTSTCELTPLPAQTPTENCGLKCKIWALADYPRTLDSTCPCFFSLLMAPAPWKSKYERSQCCPWPRFHRILQWPFFVLFYNIIFHFKFLTHWYFMARPGPNLEPQSRGARAVNSRQPCSGRVALGTGAPPGWQARRVPAWVSITSVAFAFPLWRNSTCTMRWDASVSL